MMQRYFSILIMLCIASSLIACSSTHNTKRPGSSGSPGGKEFRDQAEGKATVYDDDIALARDRAIEDARVKLVEKVLGQQISGSTVMENYKIVKNMIEAKTIGLVKDDSVIKEERRGDIYVVTIEGAVVPTAVEDAVTDILRRYGRPRLIVLIDENFEGKAGQPGLTETEIIIQNILGNSGFDFVDAQSVKNLMAKQKENFRLAVQGEAGNDFRKLLLNTMGAEVIISGSTQTKDQTAALKAIPEYSATSLQSKSAVVKLKAVDIYTGGILATMSTNAPGLHIESDAASKKAVENALEKILGGKDRSGKFKGGPFFNTLVAKFVEGTTNRQIDVTVLGLPQTDLDTFRNLLIQRIRGVKTVEVRGQTGKAAQLNVFFSGTTEEFIYELTKKADKIGFAITIKDRYPNSVNMEAQKKSENK